MTQAQGFPNGDLLWTPEQLKARLDDENLALLDARTTGEVMGGIIPGAQHLDVYGVGLTHTRGDVFGEFINLMRSLLAMRGAGNDATVVIYEQNSGMKAARVFWLLEYMGHTDVHVLDGGMRAWQAAGYETVTEMRKVRGRSLKVSPRPELFIGADELNGRLGEGDLQPLDTRSDEEWLGTNTRGGPRGGTIPGAVHLEWVNYLDEQGRFKPAAELAALFERNGVTRDKAIVPF